MARPLVFRSCFSPTPSPWSKLRGETTSPEYRRWETGASLSPTYLGQPRALSANTTRGYDGCSVRVHHIQSNLARTESMQTRIGSIFLLVLLAIQTCNSGTGFSTSR